MSDSNNDLDFQSQRPPELTNRESESNQDLNFDKTKSSFHKTHQTAAGSKNPMGTSTEKEKALSQAMSKKSKAQESKVPDVVSSQVKSVKKSQASAHSIQSQPKEAGSVSRKSSKKS